MIYYRFNEIFIEYDPYRENFYHWNPVTHVGKKDRVSKFVVSKLVINKLIPISEEDFKQMFNRVAWLKIPPFEYISIFVELKI